MNMNQYISELSRTNFQVTSAWQSRSTPSRLRSRRSSTQDSINLKNIFYLFVFLHLFFLMPFSLLLFIFFILLYFSASHSTGDNPQSWGHTSISAKAKICFNWKLTKYEKNREILTRYYFLVKPAALLSVCLFILQHPLARIVCSSAHRKRKVWQKRVKWF